MLKGGSEMLLEFYENIAILLVLMGVIVLFICFALEAIRRKKYQQSKYYEQTGITYKTLRSDVGKLGEYYTSEELKNLQGYKKYLFNCYLPKEDGTTTELDVILLHDSGIYVFESKNYSGWIFGKETDQNWTQTLPTRRQRTRKNHFLNPIIQNKVHLKWLQTYLQVDESFPIYSYIVFSERCELKDVTVSGGQHFVIKRENLLTAVQKNIQCVGNKLTKEEIDTLYAKLYPLTQVDELQKLKHIENLKENHRQKPTVGAPIADAEVTPEKICPKCGSKLIIRTAKKGTKAGEKFWGCSSYPNCKYTENIARQDI